MLRTGTQWRMMPNDLPPWEAVYQQTQRWIRWGCFEAIVHDLRQMLRLKEGRNAQPSAVILDGRTNQSTPESGGEGRAGYDGGKRKKGSKTHIAVDTLGYLLTLVVTPANEQERAQVEALCSQVQEVTGQSVELAYVDQGFTGEDASVAASSQASVLRWSNSLRLRKDLLFFLVVGWWSVVLPGSLAFVVWLVTMSACLKRWLVCPFLSSAF